MSGGRASVCAGQTFESLIEIACNEYHRRGLAVMGHYGPSVRVLGQDRGRLTVVLTGKAPPDYVGFLGNGQGVAFEAKSTRAVNRVAHTKRLHQFVSLKEMQRVAGTEHFGYLQYWEGERVATWHPITGLELDGPRRLTLLRRDGIEVPDLPGIPGIPDWLAVVAKEVHDGVPCDASERRIAEALKMAANYGGADECGS